MADTTQKIIVSAEDRATGVLRGVQSQVAGLASAFGGLVGIAGAVGGSAIVAGLRNLVGAIDDLDESAQALGTTAVELSNLRQAAGEAGIGAEKFDASLTRLNVKLSDAASGGKESVALFNALGISVRAANGELRPSTEVLSDIAARFAGMRDPVAKAALAVELFGKSGAALVPLLNQGAEGLQRFSGLTDDTVRASAQLQGELDKLNAGWEKFKFSIAAAAVPALNEFIGRLKSAADVVRDFASGNFYDPFKRQAEEVRKAEQRQKALNDTLALGSAAYSNEGRNALQSAQAVLDKARADASATKVVKDKAKATTESSNAYAKEFADVQRIREARARFEAEQEEAANRERDRRAERLRDLTGQSAAAKEAEDLELLDQAFAKGSISMVEYSLGLDAVFGKDTEQKIEKANDAAEQFGLTIASSLGEWITSGGTARDFLEALAQDILKLTTQMLILKPLTESISKNFGSSGGASGAGFAGLFADLIGSFAGGFAQGGTIPAGQWGIVGERGPELAFGGSSGQTITPRMGANNITINLPPGTPGGAATANQTAAAVSRALAQANRRFN